MNYEKIKNESFELAQTTADERNAALKNLANLLKTHEKEIIEANNKDIYRWLKRTTFRLR